MENSIYNFCWEFCYEILIADPKSDNREFFIMNLPVKFLPILKTRLDIAGFSCVSLQLHGKESVIARFRKTNYHVQA